VPSSSSEETKIKKTWVYILPVCKKNKNKTHSLAISLLFLIIWHHEFPTEGLVADSSQSDGVYATGGARL
jgi:hypothetical protein